MCFKHTSIDFSTDFYSLTLVCPMMVVGVIKLLFLVNDFKGYASSSRCSCSTV